MKGRLTCQISGERSRCWWWTVFSVVSAVKGWPLCTEYYRVLQSCIMLYHVVSCTINTAHIMIRSCHRTWQLHSGSCRDPAANRRTNHSLLLGCHEIKSLHFLNSHVPFIFLRSVRIQIEASWFAGCGTWLVTMVLKNWSFRNSPENHQKVTRISPVFSTVKHPTILCGFLRQVLAIESNVRS